ncbi:aldehyde dehydrogenase family protein [Sphingomonas endophytica]|uniref:Betaine-aldehyde dehydrogenase n=1 Tax=Sphingomonas endophytica TaxID=869719 RepID=A0A147HZL3_9SPHN|nr:aldehyde dehydrogenase family protein [Sphingomonas endophytica]KTT70419.1 betaine-aldehyde dehydrogenase [Sphingomonas endophytica]
MAETIALEGVEINSSHYINGERVGSDETFEVFSPIDQRKLGHVAQASTEQVGDAVSAALAAFPAWAALGAEGRKPYLDRFAEEIGKRTEALCQAEANDAGLLLSRLRHGIIPRAMLNITYFAEHALQLQENVIETKQATHRVRHDPAGVCAIITPWNSPLMLTTWKVGPALASGNTVVVKPPEWAPLSSSLLADAAHAAGLPAGVFNIVQGSGAVTGAALVADQRLARISFTGSVPTARTIAAIAGANLVPASLELGGKSPFIVLADADLDAAAATGALMYRNATQVCLAGTRFLVAESVRDEFVERMKDYVSKLRVGDPRDEATEVGPIIHPRQIEKVKGYVERAKAAGAQTLWGGGVHSAGELYFEPTMFAGVGPEDEIVREEVFGPVLVLQTFADDDEAVRMANDTVYGLGGVCYGEEAHATAIAEQVRTGFIWVNSFGIRDIAAPFGGRGQSGIGREGGEWSFEFFCDIKDVVIPKQPFKPSFSQR